MLYKTFEDFSEKRSRAQKKAVEFANGYGISAIRMNGAWEIAVLKDGSLCYDTHITSDVIPGLTWEEVIGVAEDIKNLPEDIPESEWRQLEYEEYLQAQAEEENKDRVRGQAYKPATEEEERKHKEWLDEALIKLRKPDEL
jgi:hypothetical protein